MISRYPRALSKLSKAASTYGEPLKLTTTIETLGNGTTIAFTAPRERLLPEEKAVSGSNTPVCSV
jgi:hypothetical protein